MMNPVNSNILLMLLPFQSAQKASIEEGKQTFLLDILKQRQALKRKQPLYPSHCTPKRRKCTQDEEISSESEDEVIPKSKFDELEKRYKSLSRKYQETLAEVKELKKLNVELQSCLVSKILSGNYFHDDNDIITNSSSSRSTK